MELALLGGLISTGIAITVLILYLRRRIRRFSSQVFGKTDILEALSDLDVEAEETPRSLNGCDSLLMPRILADFPDFDAVIAKTYVREYLNKAFGKKDDFTIYNVVMARYLPSQAQKTIVFQAAVSWRENGKRIQKRFELNYTYLLGSNSETVAANCPNCGGALGFGETECPYCGSRVANVLGNTWEFTELREN